MEQRAIGGGRSSAANRRKSAKRFASAFENHRIGGDWP